MGSRDSGDYYPPAACIDPMLNSYSMRPNPVRTWREWFFETFLRGGFFSIRALPKSRAERELEAQEKPFPKDATRLNLGERD
jgi:hypothetical protein